jgi:ABC-2 type transport system ATP-binding protein
MDMIYLETDDDEKSTYIVKDMEEITDVRSSSKGLVVSLKGEGSRFMPKLVERIKNEGIEIESVNLKKPTLDDVFVHFTGRGIREENQDKKKNNFMMSGRGH